MTAAGPVAMVNASVHRQSHAEAHRNKPPRQSAPAAKSRDQQLERPIIGPRRLCLTVWHKIIELSSVRHPVQLFQQGIRAGPARLTGLDDPSTLQAFLDAVVWGAATNADRGYLQAPFRSGVSIDDYQLVPLVRAIDMARTNLLIADDVGLGKTIEAGLVIQEMLLRHRARTVLVLCPASLQEKWRVEMQEKFGLEFRIVDTDYVKRLCRERGLHANPWTSFPRLITSMDWAKQGEGLRLLRDALPPHVSHPRKFDLLIIDEAHNVAPTVGRYAVESLRTRLVRLVILPVLTGRDRRTHAVIFSFMAGVTPPMPMLGRSLL